MRPQQLLVDGAGGRAPAAGYAHSQRTAWEGLRAGLAARRSCHLAQPPRAGALSRSLCQAAPAAWWGNSCAPLQRSHEIPPGARGEKMAPGTRAGQPAPARGKFVPAATGAAAAGASAVGLHGRLVCPRTKVLTRRNGGQAAASPLCRRLSRRPAAAPCSHRLDSGRRRATAGRLPGCL